MMALTRKILYSGLTNTMRSNGGRLTRSSPCGQPENTVLMSALTAGVPEVPLLLFRCWGGKLSSGYGIFLMEPAPKKHRYKWAGGI